MDIALKHIITMNGETFAVDWDMLDPVIMLGRTHEVRIYETRVSAGNLYSELDNHTLSSPFIGNFSLDSAVENMYTFKTEYGVGVEAENHDVSVGAFVFLCDGQPWAICTLGDIVQVREGTEAWFDFTSYVVVNNHKNLATDLFELKGDDFKLTYSAMVAAIPGVKAPFLVTTGGELYNNPNDQAIVNVLVRGKPTTPQLIFAKNKMGFRFSAKTNQDVVGIKAMFIRILWNLGIIVYVDKAEYGGKTINNLTLEAGHNLELMFKLGFTEIK